MVGFRNENFFFVIIILINFVKVFNYFVFNKKRLRYKIVTISFYSGEWKNLGCLIVQFCGYNPLRSFYERFGSDIHVKKEIRNCYP